VCEVQRYYACGTCDKTHMRCVNVPRNLLQTVFDRQLGIPMKPHHNTASATAELKLCASDGKENEGVPVAFD